MKTWLETCACLSDLTETHRFSLPLEQQVQLLTKWKYLVDIGESALLQKGKGFSKTASVTHLHLILVKARGLMQNKLPLCPLFHFNSVSSNPDYLSSVSFSFSVSAFTVDILSCQFRCYFLSHPAFLTIKLHGIKRITT